VTESSPLPESIRNTGNTSVEDFNDIPFAEGSPYPKGEDKILHGVFCRSEQALSQYREDVKNHREYKTTPASLRLYSYTRNSYVTYDYSPRDCHRPLAYDYYRFNVVSVSAENNSVHITLYRKNGSPVDAWTDPTDIGTRQAYEDTLKPTAEDIISDVVTAYTGFGMVYPRHSGISKVEMCNGMADLIRAVVKAREARVSSQELRDAVEERTMLWNKGAAGDSIREFSAAEESTISMINIIYGSHIDEDHLVSQLEQGCLASNR